MFVAALVDISIRPENAAEPLLDGLCQHLHILGRAQLFRKGLLLQLVFSIGTEKLFGYESLDIIIGPHLTQ